MRATEPQCEERVRAGLAGLGVIEWHRLSSSYFSIKLASFRCNFSLIPLRLNPRGLHDSYSRWHDSSRSSSRRCRSSNVGNDEAAVWIDGTCHGFTLLPVLKSLCLKVQCVNCGFICGFYIGNTSSWTRIVFSAVSLSLKCNFLNFYL